MKTWNKTKVQGLMRHKSGCYYARLQVGDKEKWVSLKTNLLSVAKARMKCDEKVGEIRDAQERRQELKNGKMLADAAMDMYAKELARRVIWSDCNFVEGEILRHLFATTAIESGVDVPTVANWLGHLDGGALAMKRDDQ